MNFNPYLFAVALKSRRKDLKLSLRALATQTGVSASSLSRIENHEIPDIETFGKLCGWLQISPAYFFSQSVDEPIPFDDVDEAREKGAG